MKQLVNFEFGLGRIIIPDVRDQQYPLRSILPPKPKRTYRYWNATGWWGNQGSTPQCVGYSWAHWLEDGPTTQPGAGPIIAPETIYKEAQAIDEWPGTNYEGTSVRAGADYLQAQGFIKEYRWGTSLDDLRLAILEAGPAVIGISWYEDMFYPTTKGVIRVSGNLAGGHAIKVDGCNDETKYFRLKNSWGRQWGDNGFCYLSYKDMHSLIEDYGEVCFPVEIKKKV